MKLAQYLTDNRISQVEFARRIAVAPTTLHGLISGRRGPSVQVMAAIERETDGAVMARDFCEEA